jgi:GNAT superfamily N-acetyltransferase
MEGGTMAFTIRELHTRKELQQFVDFPHDLYAGNAYWVPSMRKSELDTLDWDVNPAFAYCAARYWLAEQNGKTVGRIAGIINRRHHEVWEQPYMRFGWLDVIDDPQVTRALIGCVEAWARAEGLTAVHGPLGFTNLDHNGVLVEGFSELATLAAGYNYPYYQTHVEAAGYHKDVDYVEYLMPMVAEMPERIVKLAEVVAKRYDLHFLEAKNKKELIPYARELFGLIGAEYKHLYGVVPLTEEQVEAYIQQYFGFISPKFVPIILDKDGKMAAFGVVLPSLSRAMQKAKGRLLPFGFVHIIRALRVNDRIDLMLIAISKEYQGKGVNAMLMDRMFKVFLEMGIQFVEANPELESNIAVQAQWKHFERRQHRRRRIYIKNLE